MNKERHIEIYELFKEQDFTQEDFIIINDACTSKRYRVVNEANLLLLKEVT